VRRLLADLATESVLVIDNLSSGTLDRLDDQVANPRLKIEICDLADLERVCGISKSATHVFHFAANPDIARAMTEPTIDFTQGTVLAQNVLEAMRICRIPSITYASGSGVYGPFSDTNPSESFGPLEPISTYGASKLGCEALISAYCFMFEMQASVFRFANVVGPRQTHGVVYDFVRRLRDDSSKLVVLGNGSQEKSYIWVDDVVDAMMIAKPGLHESFATYNVSTGDCITVRRIAELTCEYLGLKEIEIAYGKTSQGWKGDVPIVRLDDNRIRSLGWSQSRSAEQAIKDSIAANVIEASEN
jgi:UDP-glucose 4-epimerase